MFKVKSITAVVVAGIIGLAACGGESSDKDDSTVTTVRQRNGSTSYSVNKTTTTTTVAPFFATSMSACYKAGKQASQISSTKYYCYGTWP